MAENQGRILTVYGGTDRVFSKAIKATLEKREGLSMRGSVGDWSWPGQGKEERAEILLSEHTGLP